MELQFLIMKMLEKDVNKRPDIANVLSYAPVKLRVRVQLFYIVILIPYIPTIYTDPKS